MHVAAFNWQIYSFNMGYVTKVLINNLINQWKITGNMTSQNSCFKMTSKLEILTLSSPPCRFTNNW